MITTKTTPTSALNASEVVIKLHGAQEFGMQFNMECYSHRTVTDSDGNESIIKGLIHTEILTVTGAAWTNWTPDAAASDSDYIAGLALAQLGLTAAPEETPSE